MANHNLYLKNNEEKKTALLTGITGAAEYLGVTVTAVRQFIDAGLIAYIKLDRQYYFRGEWLDAILPTNREKNAESEPE